VKVQILLDGGVVATQLISVEALAVPPSVREIKRLALHRTLEDRRISISQSLRASFLLFDVTGQPIDDRDDEGFANQASPE
jgi:hypothetical protein